jgi:glutamate synthase (NADPH/NADH) small chain
MRRGQSLIVWAIAEGRAAAKGVDAFLKAEIERMKNVIEPAIKPQ